MSSNVNETAITNSTDFSPAFGPPTVDHIITSIWLSVVLVFGTVGNFLLVAVILRKGRITNVTNLFNLNLAIADLIRIFLFIPVYLIYSAHDEWPPRMGLFGCKTVFMIVQNSLTASILTLMFMSMERHRAVVHPLKKQMTIRQARYMVILSWCLGFVASIWFFMTLQTERDKKGRLQCGPNSEKTWKTSSLLMLLVGLQWLPGAAFTVAYIKIIIKLRRDAVINPADVSQSSQNRHRRNLRAARILVIEVLFFLGCLLPFYHNSIASITGEVRSASPLTPEGMIVFCAMITYSLTNPFCHILLNSEFRGEVKKMNHQLKTCCGLESVRISDSSHFHLPGLQLCVDETLKNADKTTTPTARWNRGTLSTALNNA